jgi:hypothetical protein
MCLVAPIGAKNIPGEVDRYQHLSRMLTAGQSEKRKKKIAKPWLAQIAKK